MNFAQKINEAKTEAAFRNNICKYIFPLLKDAVLPPGEYKIYNTETKYIIEKDCNYIWNTFAINALAMPETFDIFFIDFHHNVVEIKSNITYKQKRTINFYFTIFADHLKQGMEFLITIHDKEFFINERFTKD